MSSPKKPRLRGLDGTWKMEEVTSRMRTPCSSCGTFPRGYRVVHVTDANPFPVSHVLCTVCTPFEVKKAQERMGHLITAYITDLTVFKSKSAK